MSNQTKREYREDHARRLNRAARQRLTDPSLSWFVLFAPAGKEFAAQRVLEKRGIVSYLTLVRRWRRANRYVRQKERFAFPALPGMLFVGFSATPPWFDVFGLSVIHGALGIGDTPHPVSGKALDAFIDRNRSWFDVEDVQRFMRSRREFAVGDTVTIADGPFEGHVVDVRAIRGARAEILVDLLGGPHLVSVALDKLEKAA